MFVPKDFTKTVYDSPSLGRVANRTSKWYKTPGQVLSNRYGVTNYSEYRSSNECNLTALLLLSHANFLTKGQS